MTDEWLPRNPQDLFGLDPADPPRLSSRRLSPLGVTVVIPTCRPAEGPHGSAIRTTLPHLIADAARAGLPLAVLVAADGLDPSELKVLRNTLAELDCVWELTELAAARPGAPDGPASAARTRNHALAWLAALPQAHRFRRRYLLFLDDDSALSPGGLGALVSALQAHPDAVAACPRVTPVESVSRWIAGAAGDAGRAGDGAIAAPLPGPWHRGRYDLLSVTSHGSLVSGRVVGLLARADPVLAWIEGGGRMFCPFTPRGSGEDMLAGAALAALGPVLGVAAATAGDEWRATPAATREQQLRWGYDHAWMVRALSHLDLLAEGVQTLEWDPAQTCWHQYDAGSPARSGPRGVLLDPPRLAVLSGMLTAAAADAESARALAGADAPRLAEAAAALVRSLEWWRRSRSTARLSQRPDLPERVPEDWAELRDGLDSRLAHVAGNALGSLAGGLDGDALPTHLLYGVRQRALGRVRARPTGISRRTGRA